MKKITLTIIICACIWTVSCSSFKGKNGPDSLTPTSVLQPTSGISGTAVQDINGNDSLLPTGNSQTETVPSDSGNIPSADNYPEGMSATLTPTDIPPTPTPDITPTEDITMQPINIDAAFYISPITDEIFARIKGKSYPDGCTLGLDQIRYVHVLHYNFDGEIVEGEIIVNAAIADDVAEIFRELFDIEYPIEKMTLIDAYDADDERSMEDNNTSAFNYRFIAETTVLSNHALGLAIDINPLYNPYVYVRNDGSTFLQPYNAGDYVDREKDNPYYIRRNDACYNIFISHGFTWGGDWNTKKDYQHFEKAQ